MIALGNDVVDLNVIPKNGSRYFDRLSAYAFSDVEESRVPSKISREVALSLLWSIKEACYKSSVKLGSKNRFSPIEFEICSIVNAKDFIVSNVNFVFTRFVVRSSITGNYIHSVAIQAGYDLANKVVGVGKCSQSDYQDQSRRVRQLVLEKHVSSKGTTIEKDLNGIPQFIRHGVSLNKELSLSHHGHFVAYAFQQ